MMSLRIDKWLWFARFCKSRSLAQSWIEAGEVLLNGAVVEKCNASVKAGDRIEMPRGRKMRVTVTVLGLAERRGSAPEAQALYQTESCVTEGAHFYK
jgi:ribosome-associated heat shock protein Hsp15